MKHPRGNIPARRRTKIQGRITSCLQLWITIDLKKQASRIIKEKRIFGRKGGVGLKFSLNRKKGGFIFEN